MTTNPLRGESSCDGDGRDPAPGERGVLHDTSLLTASVRSTNDNNGDRMTSTQMKTPYDWCRDHHALKAEDDDHCELASVCKPCHGTGFAGDWDECPACEGIGREACDLTPLCFEAAR